MRAEVAFCRAFEVCFKCIRLEVHAAELRPISRTQQWNTGGNRPDKSRGKRMSAHSFLPVEQLMKDHNIPFPMPYAFHFSRMTSHFPVVTYAL